MTASRFSIPSALNEYLNSRKTIAPEVIDAIRTQNAPLSPAQQRNIELLESGAPVVVTGQQLGVFLGPLFTIYKILSAMSYALELSTALGKTVVPIFWLQSEDHDLTEVSSVSLLDQDGVSKELKLYPEEQSALNRKSVGSITFGEEINRLLTEVSEIVGGGAGLDLFRSHYRPGQTFSDAFNASVQALFAETGLLTFDSRDAAAHRCAAPIFELSLLNHTAFESALLAQADKLESGGEMVQVKIRKGSPLFFFHPDGRHGDRYRLEQQGSEFIVSETGFSITSDELRKLLIDSPGHFSTSALLRPLVQDHLLPTIAYVAGPAEEQYWKQITPLYALLKRPQPLVVPRGKLLLLEPKTLRMAQQLGIPNDELILEPASLRTRLEAGGLEKQLTPTEVKAQLEERTVRYLDSVLSGLTAHDPSLVSELTRTKEKVERSVQAFIDKLHESLARREKASGGKAEKLFSRLAPGGISQERGCSFIQYWLKYERRLLDTVTAALQPVQGEMKAVEIA